MKAVLITQQGEVLAKEIVPIRSLDWRGAVEEAFTKMKATSVPVSCFGPGCSGVAR